MNQKMFWISGGVIGGGIAAFVIFMLLGGLYTITTLMVRWTPLIK